MNKNRQQISQILLQDLLFFHSCAPTNVRLGVISFQLGTIINVSVIIFTVVEGF